MKELDILAKALKNLSQEELDALIDSVSEKSPAPKKVKKTAKKEPPKNKFDDMSIQENPRIREISKKLNQGLSKSDARLPKQMTQVKCQNCGKEWELPVDYPSIRNFTCCVRK